MEEKEPAPVAAGSAPVDSDPDLDATRRFEDLQFGKTMKSPNESQSPPVKPEGLFSQMFYRVQRITHSGCPVSGSVPPLTTEKPRR